MQLGYCTNVHAGADLAETRENLARYAVEVKRRVSPARPLGIGLWLSRRAASELLAAGELPRFRAWLAEAGLVPFTLNGFPYGNFHQPVVKHEVYRPTWCDPLRLEYTRDLVRILDALLPPATEGSISTLPIAWGAPPLGEASWAIAVGHLRQLAEELAALERQRGRTIYLCIEPEPGCALQWSQDIVRLFEQLLVGAQEAAVRRHLRVCHDVCHAAVMFEEQADVVRRYEAAGILIGKVQISSAVAVPLDRLPAARRAAALTQLAAFAEDRYLHQTMIRTVADQPAVFFEDLPQALARAAEPELAAAPWRIHFHVPIYVDRFGHLAATREAILDCIRAVSATRPVPHWEVETYAWGVLPAELRVAELAEGIARELTWFQALRESGDGMPS